VSGTGELYLRPPVRPIDAHGGSVTVGGLLAAGEQLARTTVPYHPSTVPPIGRWGVPDEVARVIAFLAGDMASYVTGISMLVDGGNHAAGGWHRTDVSP
jgi:NAD(P)-dependent dehydrogenase (short-subunit alcohol dehydrogenase family)